ncbi:L-aspartate 1-decarboxylase [Mariprofundus aestuarium]|uniref:Aspartate 1-decarboxylase n=1 Tax=Mariprofundus aestuarium TaxID=1921086 RepID=A0A2K8KZ49_MARES|nr:aspartate 1-decarboxylase [Mariprofundus aestuarium]ATX80213.1 L-aspartate 1-decarboxylase [Mariprofundus aestuarium]
MKLTMLKSKVHRATVTHAELDYEGSCAIDQNLLDAANILPFEQLHIYNVANGERFTTYAITAPRGSGTIGVNGAAAHKANPGDLLIICTYAELDAKEAEHFNPALVYVDSDNAITHTSHGHLAAA